jgi:electron transfer flavoprotein alpha subunit
MKILVIAEHRGGKFKKGSLECVAQASRLGGEVVALVIGGKEAHCAAGSLGKQGAARVLAAGAPWLERYNGDAYARIAADVVKSEKPDAVFVAATLDGKDLAPRVAARLDVGYAPDCTKVEKDGARLKLVRPVYAGKAYATVKLNTSPQLVSIRPNSYALLDAPKGDAPVSDAAIGVSEGDVKSKVVDIEAAKSDKADLSEAEIIVSGGRGLKEPKNFSILEEFARELGAAVGASRAVVDAGWRPHADQVGQTGKTVSPNLYFAIGISGAIQHLAGMSTSKVIVAVNKDQDAPIFKIANYGVVGDLFEVVPKMTEEVKKLKRG